MSNKGTMADAGQAVQAVLIPPGRPEALGLWVTVEPGRTDRVQLLPVNPDLGGFALSREAAVDLREVLRVWLALGELPEASTMRWDGVAGADPEGGAA